MKNQIKKAVKFSTLVFVAILITATQKVNAQYCSLTGNAGTNASTNFIGTTDNVAFKIRTKNAVRLTVTGGGKVGIGTASPIGKLDVKDNLLSNLANFDGGNNMYIAIKENGNYRGYLGSWSGAAEDVDFGTGVNNTTGSVNFTIEATPKMTILTNVNIYDLIKHR